MASPHVTDLKNWMSLLPESTWDKPLYEIAIPGTHNSFSYSLDPSSEMGPDVSDAIKAFGQIAKGIVYKWSVTQNQSFTEQLESGIRYFDLRVASRSGTEDIHFLHGLYASTVETGLKQINTFLDEHKKEIVILDFNKFYNMTECQHRDFMSSVVELFGSKLCVYVGTESLTPGMMWENNLQVIVINHYTTVDDLCQVWPGKDCIRSPWANTPSVPKLLDFLETNYTSERGNHFHVCQGILTPDTGFILSHLSGSLKNDIAKKVMPPFLDWINGKRAGKNGVNICIADYTDMNDFATKIIELNYAS